MKTQTLKTVNRVRTAADVVAGLVFAAADSILIRAGKRTFEGWDEYGNIDTAPLLPAVSEPAKKGRGRDPYRFRLFIMYRTPERLRERCRVMWWRITDSFRITDRLR